MAEVNGARLRDLINFRGSTQSAVAEGIGVTQPTIGRLISSETKEFGKLLELAAFLKTTPEYLVDWSDKRDLDDDSEPERAPARAAALTDRRIEFRGPDPEPEHDPADIVWLREVDAVLGMGGGFLDVDVETRLIPFPTNWIRQFSDASSDFLSFLPARGTSMEPTITDRSMCLIDLSRKAIDEQDELWACVFGGLSMVKRLRVMPDGSVKVMSDNKSVSDEIAADGDLHIMGRCCGVLRRT